MDEFAFETGLFDEPTGIDFVAIFATVDRVTFVFGGFGFFITQIDIFEE